MLRTLIQVNLHNDLVKLDEIIQLIVTIKTAWDEMPREIDDNEK